MDARTAVAGDGDRLLAEAGLLGKATLPDQTGRTCPVLIVLAGSTAEGREIHVSYLTDILAANECGAPFDLSIPAVFRRLCPKINFPESELRRFAGALLERIDAVPKAAAKIIERWGRPDDWGRNQVTSAQSSPLVVNTFNALRINSSATSAVGRP